MRRRAFTLTELLVALAVTVVVLLAVASIFAITTQTASQAAAAAEVQALADRFARQLRDDLAAVDPARSVLVIVGRTQLAAQDEARRQAGVAWRVLVGDPDAVPGDFNPDDATRVSDPRQTQYSDPRADILMFFADEELPSAAPPRGTPAGEPHRSLQNGARLGPVQIVYGHAALADVSRQRGSLVWAVRHIETDRPRQIMSAIPARRWVLARRVVLIHENPLVPGPGGFPFNAWPRILRMYDPDVTIAADVVDYALSDPQVGLLPLLSVPAAVGASPYRFESDAGWAAYRDGILKLLYPPLADERRVHHVATVAVQAPPDIESNQSLVALPGCAWFEVQFLMPEDPRNSRLHPDPAARAAEPRWISVEPGRTYVFVPDSPQTRALLASQTDARGRPTNRLAQFGLVVPGPQLDTVENRIIRLWPYAIRVTVRVFDRQGRLEEPLVRTVTHWFE